MSASARRTLDTDNITLRTVFARGPNNSNIDTTNVLTADGRGGTRWIHPSSLGAFTLNYISTDTHLIQWDLSLNNVFYLTGGKGIGVGSTNNQYEANIYAKAYQALYDRNTESTMTVEDSIFELYSTIYLSTTTQQFYTTMDRTKQTLYWNMNPFRFLVANNSTPTLADISYNEVNFDNINSTIRLMGTKDIQLTTISSPQRAIYVSISTFTSEGYLGLSGEISSLRGMSTTMPYHFRSTFLLNASNSYPRIGNLSTPYVGNFLVSIPGTVPPSYIVSVPSSIGFPFVGQGLRGANVIEQFQSTINSNPFTVSISEFNSPYTGDVYFSTLSFSMAPFSTFINRNNSTSIVLSYTPTYLFTGYSTSGSVGTINPIGFSTFITANDEVIPTTQTDDIVYFTDAPPFRQNFYKANLNISLSKAIVVPRYTCTFTVNHYMPNALAGYSNPTPATWPPTSYNFTRTGISSPVLNAPTPARNSAYITIIGS